MHIVFFRNGYANQLFQLCLYFKLKEKYSDDVYGIGATGKFKSNGNEIFFKKYITLIQKLPKTFILIDENNFESIKSNESKNYFYIGEWQDCMYFPKKLDFLNDIFKFDNLGLEAKEIYKKIITNPKMVAIHVRRRDYVDSCILSNVANEIYFKNCIKHICEINSSPSFIVFSDDIKWCKNKLNLPSSTLYLGSFKPWEDIFLMSLVKYLVISNSTYSWWGKTINNNNKKTILAPKYWFNYKIVANPLNRDDCILINNFKLYNKECNSPKFSLVMFINIDEREIVNSSLLSAMNQNETCIEIYVIVRKNDLNIDLIKCYAKLDNRIKILFVSKMEFYFKRVRDVNCKSDYVFIYSSSSLLKPNCCNEIFNKYDNIKKQNNRLEFGYFFYPTVSKIKKIYNFIFKKNELKNCSYFKLVVYSTYRKMINKCKTLIFLNKR